jgi:hypothetical protein
LNGSETSGATQADQSSVLAALDSPLFNTEERIESLFLGTLARLPSDAERQVFTEHVTAGGDSTAALGDILWALLNSAEFTLNH